MLKITKKSTKVIITSVITFLMAALFALTGVGVGLAFWNKNDGNSKPTNPIIWSSDKYDGSAPDTSSLLKGVTFAKRCTKTYTINSARSFMKFVEIVNSDAAADYNYFREYTIYLNKNIDMNGYSLSPIGKKLTDSSGNAFSSFQGVFDGSYYTISNATINGNGLFGYVEDATIRNIGLYNCNIASDADYVGGLVGEAINTTIENSYVRLGSISANRIAGGLVGKLTIDRTKNANLPQNLIVNSFVDTTIEANSFGGLVGEIVSNNDSAENNGTISYSYFTGNGQVTYINNPNIVLDNVVDVKYGANFSAYNVRKYSAELLSETNAWTNYQHVENSPAMDFNYPMLAEFVKVFMTGSAYENVLVKDGKVENVTTLYEAFKEVEHNQDGEINVIVEQVTMDDTAVAGDGATVTLNAAVDTKILRNTASKTVEHMIVGATGSTLVLGDENATENSPKLVLDGQKDTVEENKLKSGALIFAQGEDFDIYSNVVLQNNINNTTNYGGALCLFAVDSGLPKTGEDENSFVSGVNVAAEVSNCTAKNGGGIASINNGLIISGEVHGNAAIGGEYGGGGIALGLPIPTESSFVSLATKYGGSKKIQTAVAKYNNKKDIKSTANSKDRWQIANGSAFTATVSADIYCNSTTGAGGGIFAGGDDISNSKLTINASVTKNKANRGGGGIIITFVACTIKPLTPSTPINISCNGYYVDSSYTYTVNGAGLYARYSTLNISGGVKMAYNNNMSNSITTSADVSIVTNSIYSSQYSWGGGMALEGCYGSIICNVSYNKAIMGGGVHCVAVDDDLTGAGETLTFSASTFLENVASGKGGGICLDVSAADASNNPSILAFGYSNVFSGNRAVVGAGINCELGGDESGQGENFVENLDTTHCNFVENTASDRGNNTWGFGSITYTWKNGANSFSRQVYYLDEIVNKSSTYLYSSSLANSWVITNFTKTTTISTVNGTGSTLLNPVTMRNIEIGMNDITYYATVARRISFEDNSSIARRYQVSNYNGTSMGWYNASSSAFTSTTTPTVKGVTDWTTYGWVDGDRVLRASSGSSTATSLPYTCSATTLHAAVRRTLTYYFKANGGSGSMSNQTKTTMYVPTLSTGVYDTNVTLNVNTYTPPTEKVFAGWRLGTSAGEIAGMPIIKNGASYTPTVGMSDSPFAVYLWAQWTDKTWHYGYLDANGGTILGENTTFASTKPSGITYDLSFSSGTLINRRAQAANTYNNTLQISKLSFTTYVPNQAVTFSVTYVADGVTSYGMFGYLDVDHNWMNSLAGDTRKYELLTRSATNKIITYNVPTVGSHFIYVGWQYGEYDVEQTASGDKPIVNNGKYDGVQVENPNSFYGTDNEISSTALRDHYWLGYGYYMMAKVFTPGTGTYSNATTSSVVAVNTKGNESTSVTSGTTKSYAFTREGEYYVSGNKGVNYSLALYKYSFRTTKPNTTVIFDVVNSGETNYDFAVFAKLDTDVSSSATDGGWNWNSYSANQFANFKGKSDNNTTTNTTKQVVYEIATTGLHYIMWGFRKDSSNSSYKDCAKVRIHQNTSNEAIATATTASNSNSATSYAYTIDSNGYYVVGNKGIKNSLSLYKYTFTTTFANQTVNFDVISYGENNFDYAVFGKLDTDVSSAGSSAWTYSTFASKTTASQVTNCHAMLRGKSSASVQTVSYTVAKTGTHYFMWGYRKDGSGDTYDDIAKLKLAYNPEVTVTEIYNQEIGYLPPAQKTGYEFVGWKSNTYEGIDSQSLFDNALKSNQTKFTESTYYKSSELIATTTDQLWNNIGRLNYSVVGPYPFVNSSGNSWTVTVHDTTIFKDQYIYEVRLYNSSNTLLNTISGAIVSFTIPSGTTQVMLVLNDTKMVDVDYTIGKDLVTYSRKAQKYYSPGDYVTIKANNNLTAMYTNGSFVSSSTLASEMGNMFGLGETDITGIRFDTYKTIADYNAILESNGQTTYTDTGLRLSTGIPIYRQGTTANFAFVLGMNIKYSALANYFRGWTALKTVVFNNLNTSGCTSLGSLFYNCTELTSVTFGGPFTISPSLTNVSHMFHDCKKLTSVNMEYLTGVTSSVNMAYTFYSCQSLQSVKIPFTVVSSLNYTFGDCRSLTSLDFTNTTFTNISAGYAFYCCTNLKSITFAAGCSVTTAAYMFGSCSALESLDISNIDFSNVTTTYSMFTSCSKLKTIIGLNTIGETAGKLTDMSWMFTQCYALESVAFSSSIDTSKVTNFSHMFYNCTGLQTLSLDGFTFSSGANVAGMLNFGPNNKILYISQGRIINNLGTTIPITTHTSTSRLFDTEEKVTNPTDDDYMDPAEKTVLGDEHALIRGSYLTFNAGGYGVSNTSNLSTSGYNHTLNPYNAVFRIVLFYNEKLTGTMPTSYRTDGYYLSYWVKSGTSTTMSVGASISEDTVLTPNWMENGLSVVVNLNDSSWSSITSYNAVSSTGTARGTFMTLRYFDNNTTVQNDTTSATYGTVVAPASVGAGNVVFRRLPVGKYFIMAPVSQYNLTEVPCAMLEVSNIINVMVTTVNYYTVNFSNGYIHNPTIETPEGYTKPYMYPNASSQITWSDDTQQHPMAIIAAAKAGGITASGDETSKNVYLTANLFTSYTGTTSTRLYQLASIGLNEREGYYRKINKVTVPGSIASGAKFSVDFYCVQNVVKVKTTPTYLPVKVQLYQNGTAVTDIVTTSNGVATFTGIDTGSYQVWASATAQTEGINVLVPTGKGITCSGGTIEDAAIPTITYGQIQNYYGVKVNGSDWSTAPVTNYQLRTTSMQGSVAVTDVLNGHTLTSSTYYVLSSYVFDVYAPEICGAQMSTTSYVKFDATLAPAGIRYINYGAFAIKPRLDESNGNSNWINTYSANIKYTIYRKGTNYSINSPYYDTITDPFRKLTYYAKEGLEFDIFVDQVVSSVALSSFDGGLARGVTVTTKASSADTSSLYTIDFYTVHGITNKFNNQVSIQTVSPYSSILTDYYILSGTTLRTTSDGSKIEIGNGGATSKVLYTYKVNVVTGYASSFLAWSYSISSASGNYKTVTTTGFEVNSTTKNINIYPQGTQYAFYYYIKYNANGGAGTMSNSQHSYGQKSNLKANTYSRYGYTFKGWATSASSTTVVATDKAELITSAYGTGSGTVTATVGTTIIGSVSGAGGTINLYAVWEVNKYTIMFMMNCDDYLELNNGSDSNHMTDGFQVTYSWGTQYTLPKTPFTNPGYRFVGWSVRTPAEDMLLNNETPANYFELGATYTKIGGSGKYAEFIADGASIKNLYTSGNYNETFFAIWESVDVELPSTWQADLDAQMQKVTGSGYDWQCLQYLYVLDGTTMNNAYDRDKGCWVYDGTEFLQAKGIQLPTGISVFVMASALDNPRVSEQLILAHTGKIYAPADSSHLFEPKSEDLNLYYLEFANFDTSRVTNMSFMFANNNSLTNIVGLDKFDTSNVTNMQMMFYHSLLNGGAEGCTIDLSKWNTSKVQTFDGMFSKTTIGDINLSGWTFESVTVGAFDNMFRLSESLPYLDLSSWDWTGFDLLLESDAGHNGIIANMFTGCTFLMDIKTPHSANCKVRFNLPELTGGESYYVVYGPWAGDVFNPGDEIVSADCSMYYSTNAKLTMTFNNQTLASGTYNKNYSASIIENPYVVDYYPHEKVTRNDGVSNLTYTITSATFNGSTLAASSGKYNGLSLVASGNFSGTPTAAGTYVFTVKATHEASGSYATAQITVVIGKATMAAPTVTVATDGKVTWTSVTGATSYQISIDGSTWTTATSGVNYNSTIVASTGLRTVRVRAVTTDTNNYVANGAIGTKGVYVYNLTLNKGTGIASVTGAGSYIGGRVVTITATVSTGYTFKAWTGASTATTASTTITIPSSSASSYALTATANTNANTYTIAYNGNGSTGGSTASSTHTYNVAKTLTKNGYVRAYTVTFDANQGSCATASLTSNYTFNGWAESASGAKVYKDEQSVTNLIASGTKTLYANWTAVAITLPSASRTGYTFAGWYTAASGGNKVGDAGASYTPAAGIKLYAHWNVNSQTVTYNATENGGTFGSASGYSSTATVNYGAAVDVSKTNRYGTKSGWTFVGWNTNKDATTALSSYTMGTSNVTLYAIYSKTFTATFIYYNNKTTEVPKTIYNKATAPVSITAPGALGTPSGYSFRGWSTDKAANAKITVAVSGSISISADVTYYASYQKTVTAIFYYSTLTKDNFTYSVKASTTTAAAIQYYGYTGTIINSNFTVPSAVTSSTGGASAENYIGVANAINSATVVTPTTANTKFYAVYTESLTFYYYNGTAHTSTTLTRRMLCDGTNYANSLSATAPTPSNYNGASFTSWQYQSNPDQTYAREPLTTGVNELFAKYTLSVTATFNYYDGSKAATATASENRYYVSKNGGINTTENNFTIPTVVSANRTISNVAYTYRGVSTATTANAAVATPTTANTAFYASYTYTVKVTFDGNNATSGTAPTAVSGTAYMNYKADKVGLTITVPANPFGRTGYALAAKPWNTNAAGTGTGYSANAAATFTANTTLYAAWTANELTFSAQELNVTYSTSAQTTTFTGASNGTGSYTYSITAGNTGSYFTISGTTITVKASTPVHTYNLTVHVVDNGSGKTKDATITIIVKKAAGSISYATKTITKTYGDAAFTNALTKVGDGTVTYSSSATGVATVDGTGKVTIKGAGTTTITATVADGTSYTYATKTATYTLKVNKKTLTVTAANKTITYGEALPSYTYSITGFVNNETESVLTTKPTATCSYVRYGNVGTYDITVSGAAAANYSFSYVKGTLTVNKRTVTATWPSTVSFGYDGNVHKVEATIGNLVNNDAVTFTYTGTTSATAAGDYKATINGLSGTKAGNYSLPSNLEQDWSIGTASVILTVDSSKTVVYGSTATVSYKSNVAGKFTITSNSTSYVTVATGYTQTVEANKAYTFTINGVKAGSGTITVAFAPTDSKNYTAPANKTVNVTVDRATIANVPSQSGTLTYNGNAQSPSWNNYDSVKMTIGGTTSGTNVGTYAATFTPTSNYKWSDGTTTAKTVNWSIGKLVVTKPTAKTNLTYTGSSITGVTFSTGVGYSVKSGSTAAINAGNYSAVFTLDGNHTWSDGTADVTVNWSIAKKSVAVVWGTTTSWIYDGQSHAPTASATGVTGETLNLTVSGAQVNASSSSYTAAATLSSVTGGQAKTSNYTLTNTTKAFTISARAITVTANSASKVYDRKALTANGAKVTSDTKLVTGHKLSYTVTGSITNVGSVANVISNVKVLDASGNDVSSNYKITTANGTLKITAKVTTFTVTVKETSYVYDGSEKQPTITVKAGDVTLTAGTDYTVSGTTKAIKVGNYTITITGAGNYAGSNGSATWTITKATVTVPTAPADKTYTGVSQNSGITNPTHSSIVAASSTTSATNVGSYNVVLKLDDADNYQWNDGATANKTIVWKIVAKSLKDCTVTLAYTTVNFDGTAKTPAVTVKIGSTTIASSNYTVKYTKNTYVGTATVTISGNTNLKDTVELTFTIKAVGYKISYTKMINNVETTLTTTNKTGYDVSTSAQTISLTAPTLAGHTFTGWTITNTASTSKATLSGSTVTIPANSYGAFKLTAHFTVNNYTISYNYDGGSVATANKTTYQISANAQTFTLNVPTKSGYRFTSWTLTNTDSTTSKATVSGNTVTIPANSYGNFAIKANYEQVISVTLQIIKPESSKASYSFAEYKTSNDAINKTNVITSFTMDGATTSTSNGITTITKQIVVGKDYYLAIVSAEATAAVGNKYELLCVYNNEQLLTEMPVKTISGANASGRYKITASTTIKLEFFSAVKVDLEATATETDSTKLVGWTNVTVKTKDGKEEIENSQYIIREGATWTAKIDSTHLGAEDALMGIKYVLADGTTGTITTTGDDNIKYDSANGTYTISADVVTLTPIVKTPIELEVVSSNVTLTETKDKIVKNNGTIKVYAGTWELTFSGEDTPASASDVAKTVFGVTNVTVDSTTKAASWTSSNGKWKFTVSKNSTDGKYYLTIASV